ncbi:MAG: TetR/AcrR family transcriptional regulator [Alphaproteobacteria bacterium]|nr:TetR/AcrR family transcriptional regulator [Alphaproteobacteria bacterium]
MGSRDKEGTKRRLIEAAGLVMARDGFAKLGVNTVAREAGVDKVLIYRYFGGLEGLIETYAEEGDFWPTVEELIKEPEAIYRARPAAEQMTRVFRNLVASLRERPVTLEILAWEMTEHNDLTRRLDTVRENLAREFTRRFGNAGAPGVDLMAFSAILAGAVNYLTARSRHIGAFNGMDIESDQGWKRLDDTLELICKRVLG